MLREHESRMIQIQWGVVTDAVIRAQAQERRNPKPLKVKEMTSKVAVDKEGLFRLKDSTLQKFKEAKGTKTWNTGFLTRNVEKCGTGYVSERMSGKFSKADFGFQVVESESNGGGSRFFVW